MTTPTKLRYLEDRWDEAVASTLDAPELLRYRSNLLGSDLRLTNFGGGNTSSKIEEIDPLDGGKKTVLWVKGSGGDLGSIKRAGFATLYLDKVLALAKSYKGVEREDEIVAMYPLCTFGNNPVAASIDTPLHGFLPFPHVDHLHPDWGIALAASANGLQKMEEFNQRFGHKIVWVPWQRPGFELAMMLRDAVAAVPGCDGVVLGRAWPVHVGPDTTRELPEYHHDHRPAGAVHGRASQEERNELWRGEVRFPCRAAEYCVEADAGAARSASRQSSA